eukprot:861256-Pleurochrysis_carterae.AAC.1
MKTRLLAPVWPQPGAPRCSGPILQGEHEPELRGSRRKRQGAARCLPGAAEAAASRTMRGVDGDGDSDGTRPAEDVIERASEALNVSW